MRHRLTSAALALAIVSAACSDAPTATTSLRPFDGILQHTMLEDFIQAAIDRYLPKGFESAVEARWATVRRKKDGGDMNGAIHEFNKLSLWIDKKTPDITIPSGEIVTKEQAAAVIIVNMGRWLYEGAAADPLVVPTGDVVLEVVPAGAPLSMVVPSKHASIRWDAGATQEERVVVLLEDGQPYPAQCQGPLATRRCQYPLFYKVESFPHTRLQSPGRIGVCMVTTGNRRPIEFSGDEPTTTGSHGPVGERLRLAHNLPPNPADRHPQGVIEDGIEILPLSETQSGLTDCNAHSHAMLSPVQKALHNVLHLAGRMVTPRNAYAFDLGPEHEFSFFSNFNAVDPTGVPDVAITGLTGPTTAEPSATVPVSYRLANRSRRSSAGSATATSGFTEVTLFLSTDATLDEGDDVVPESEERIVPLAPGDSTDPITFSVPLPETPGTYYIIANAVQEEGSLAECEPGVDPEFPTCYLANNTVAHQIVVQSPVVPIALNLQSVGMMTGASNTFAVTSGAPAPFSWTVSFGGEDQENGSAFGSVTPDENSASASYTAPVEAPVGTGGLQVCVHSTAVPDNRTCASVNVFTRPPAGNQQEQPLVDGNSGNMGVGGTSEQILAQVVVPTLDGVLTSVAFPVICSSGNLLVQVRGVTGVQPNAVVLASQSVPAGSLPPVFEGPIPFRTITFTEPASVASGTPFSIVLSSSDGVCSVAQAPVGNPYLSADAFFDARPNPAGVWAPLSIGTGRRDLPFKTHIDTPPILDQSNDPETGTSFHCGNGGQSLFQGFTRADRLTAVELRLRAGGSFPAEGMNTTIRILAGTPTSGVLGTATATVPPGFTQGLVRFNFSPALELSGDSELLIEWLSPPFGPELSAGTFLGWMGVQQDTYAGGTAYGCTGLRNADSDLNFRTYR